MTVRQIVAEYAGIKFIEETSFGTDPGTGYTQLRATNIKPPDLEYDIIAAGYQKPVDERGPDKAIVGCQKGKFTFEVPLRGGNAAEAPCMSLMKRMGVALNSQAIKTGLVTGNTSVTLTLLDINAADMAIGCMLHHIPQAGASSIRFVKGIASLGGTTTLTVGAAFAVTPTNGDTLAAVDTITPCTGTAAKTFTFKVYLGQGSTNRLLRTLTGCSGTWKIKTTEAGKVPVVEFAFDVDGWVDSEANIAFTADTFNPAKPIKGDTMFVDTAACDIKHIGFDPGLTCTPIPAASGTNGRQTWMFSKESVPKLDISPLWDTAWGTGLGAASVFEIQFGSIKDANESWGLYVGAAQVVKNGLDAQDGIYRDKLEFLATEPGADAAGHLIPKWSFGISH